jgi:3-oxoacyl-[acyl-carrier protein] reductase
MREDISLDGVCVLVTGGSMGIGLAAAKACLLAGARVGICARDKDMLNASVNCLREQGLNSVIGIRGDVTEHADLDRILDGVEGHFGPLNAVIHAAAILGPIGPIVDTDPSTWLETLRVNLYGSFLVLQTTAARMAQHGGGRVVLFAGGGAGGPFPNYSSYACSKVAVVRLTEIAAIEFAPLNIEVNCVAPGFVITRMHDQTLAAGEAAGVAYLKRTQDEIAKGGVPASVGARAAVFLISPAALGITGKFVAAQYDGFEEWPNRLEELTPGDLFTLRRIIPRDRGMEWQ